MTLSHLYPSILGILLTLSLLLPTGLASALVLTSPDFTDQAPIPRQYTCDGSDSSPALNWHDVPSGTQSFALTVDDPDAPVGNWIHWVVYNLPGNLTGLPAAVTRTEVPGLTEGKNSWGQYKYGGPCPPNGNHRYVFTLYALDSAPDLPAELTKTKLRVMLDNRVLAKAILIGVYSKTT